MDSRKRNTGIRITVRVKRMETEQGVGVMLYSLRVGAGMLGVGDDNAGKRAGEEVGTG